MNTFEMTVKCNEDNMDYFTTWGLYELKEIVGSVDWEYDYDEDTTEVRGLIDDLGDVYSLEDYSKMVSEECRARVKVTCYDNYDNIISFNFRNGKKIA